MAGDEPEDHDRYENDASYEQSRVEADEIRREERDRGWLDLHTTTRAWKANTGGWGKGWRKDRIRGSLCKVKKKGKRRPWG